MAEHCGGGLCGGSWLREHMLLTPAASGGGGGGKATCGSQVLIFLYACAVCQWLLVHVDAHVAILAHSLPHVTPVFSPPTTLNVYCGKRCGKD